MSIGIIRKSVLFFSSLAFLALIATTPSNAVGLPISLPTMYVGSPKTFLSSFPLAICRSTTPEDVLTAYGKPQMKIEGAGEGKEIWTFYKKSITYTFYFVKGKIYDVTVAYTGSRWAGGTLSARELQNVERRP